MGTLVPPWYTPQKTSQTGLLVAAFFLGASMAVAAFAFAKASRQSHRSWCRNHKIQCLMQILANRLSLIMYNPEKGQRLKVGLLIAIGIINVSVFCIWIPARLQISHTFIRVNDVWDRMEKVLFAIIDMCLNIYFMYLVRVKLVANGLTQYMLLYKFNLVMVIISISLDVLVIGLMSLPDDAVYVQAHPLTFLAKLYIEMNMAELLGKIVKRSSELRASLPSTDQPHLGPVNVFDREWLGSANEIIMPTAGDTRCGGGGGQMHELNMDILNDCNSDAAKASGSAMQGDEQGEHSQREAGDSSTKRRSNQVDNECEANRRKEGGGTGTPRLDLDLQPRDWEMKL
ncbi:hypothetical protein VTI74DRAFT_11597 [Chaetomium olivicolor]